MGVGKVLVLIGALLTLVSTFFLSLFEVAMGIDASGIGFVFNIPNILTEGPAYAVIMGTEVMIVYILTIVYLVFILSGILQLVGLASRVVAIIGSILPIVISVLIIFILLGVLDYGSYTLLFMRPDIIEGILPFHVAIGSPVSLGTYTLLAGGVLGLVGGILSTKDEY